MLTELAISNFAIIAELHLAFDAGFSVLTGETGAGKSIIIDAMNLLLGGRASADVIRTGEKKAVVEGIFALDAATRDQLEPLLCEQGLVAEDDTLIIRREVSQSRRSTSRINGAAVTLSTLQAVGHHLVDIHGQGDHLSLLQERHHIAFLDRFGGLGEQRQVMAEIVAELRAVEREMTALQRDERETARRIELLQFQVDEIGAANLDPNEEPELLRQRSLLANAERRMQLAASGYGILSGSEDDAQSATDLLNDLVEVLDELADVDPDLGDESQRAQAALDQMSDLARLLRQYRDDVEFDPEGLSAIEERLALIASLKRKYGDTLTDVLAFADRAQSELDQINGSSQRLDDLAHRRAEILVCLGARASELSASRQRVAQALQKSIETQLSDLNMDQARFVVDQRSVRDDRGVKIGEGRYRFDATGIDRVEFLIAPNPGEEPKPLARIASGGETSRLMLALKTALSEVDPVPTLIFDEVDAGIGGRTGAIVGHKLWTLSQHHQVFCITHLAQIAAFGADHHTVSKGILDGRTISTVHRLSEDERVDEIAVMLGGEVTDTSRRNARELMARSAS